MYNKPGQHLTLFGYFASAVQDATKVYDANIGLGLPVARLVRVPSIFVAKYAVRLSELGRVFAYCNEANWVIQ